MRPEAAASPPPAVAGRIASIDQLRGYAIFGMIFVNYFGEFAATPHFLRHHHGYGDWPPFGISYADTIAPLFIFVVGIGFRLSFQRHAEKGGLATARWAAVKRYVTLIVLGYFLYGYDIRNMWDALCNIGFAGLLALPFITAPMGVRIGAAIGYLAVHDWILVSERFWSFWRGVMAPLGPLSWPRMAEHGTYQSWTLAECIDGGPFGASAWVFCLLMGTVAYDVMAGGDRKRLIATCLGAGFGMVVLAWALRLLWPGDLNTWQFSMRMVSAPFPLVATGLAFLALLFFVWLADGKGVLIPGLTVLGMNALTIYIVQYAVLEISGAWWPRESPLWIAAIGFVVFYGFNYAVARRLYRDGIVIRL